MKRKVIQIADSTQLVSLPRKWAVKYGVKKGDELEIEEKGNKIYVSTEKGHQLKKVELDTGNFEIMVPRAIHALYKGGVDEIKVLFSSQDEMKAIQKALGKEAVGFEITNQGNNFCDIRHVSGELEDFDLILKRTFLLLLSMSEQVLETIKKGKFSLLPNIAFLEEANNRFTTSCRRFINKTGSSKYNFAGPVYYILEELENLADEYKYLCNHLHEVSKKKNDKKGISKNSISAFEETDRLLREFYEVFYKFDKDKLVDIAQKRKQLISDLCNILENADKVNDRILAHYSLVITQKIFCLIGPYLVLTM